MANITFNDLPTRASLGSNDFFIINSSNRAVLPEGKINYNTLKKEIREDLLTTNYNFNGQNNVIVKTSSTANNTITINDRGKLIIFDNPNNKVFGFFQLECLRTGTVTLPNVLCQYSLLWIPVDTRPGVPRLPQILVNNAFIAINNSTTTITNSFFQNIQIDNFTPQGNGNFRLTVRFTQDIPAAKAMVDYKLTLFQQG
jgi:hypothetical protein